MQILSKFYKAVTIFLLSALLSATISVSVKGASEGSDASVRQLGQKIAQTLQTSLLKGASVGIQVVSLKTGETVFQKNHEQTLNPASNTKLVTSAAALVKLTPQFRFETSLHTASRVQNGVLEGDLYLKGRGDPVLSYEALLALANDLYTAGIEKISGNIIGDDTYFDDEREFSGWHDFSKAYSGKISGLSLNKNSVSLRIKPASRSGVAPQLILDPPTSYITIKNKAVTLSTKNKVYASFLPAEQDATEETLLVEGKISRKSSYGVSAYINVSNPSLFAATSLKDALEQIGIKVEGHVKLGQLPRKSRRLAAYYSEPLSSIICESNKSSDNFVAEQLLKTLGAEELGEPGTTKKGLQVIQEFLAGLNIPPEAYMLENGSGLSRNNRISPEQIVSLLTYMYENFEVRSEYLASLAIAGVDGTLSRRMRDTQAERRLRAKTGAINSVSCLSGYAASRDNEVFAFSIMMNDYRSGGYDIKKIQNKIGLLLTEFYRPTYKAEGGKQ